MRRKKPNILHLNAPSEIVFSIVLAYLRLQHTHWAYLKENLQFIALQNRTPPITKIICVKNARAWVSMVSYRKN